MSKVTKATLGLMIATIIAKVLGFARELVLASAYGVSIYSDAYITAMNIPLVILSIIGATLNTIFIPIYYEINKQLGEEGSLKFTNNVFNIIILVCALLTILCLIFINPLVRMFAIGFKGDALNVAVNFTKITISGIIFTGLSYLMTAYLQIKNNFIIPGLISVPKNIIIIFSIILSYVLLDPYIMIWGSLIGFIIEFLFQVPFVIKNGYRYKLYINICDKYIKKAIYLIGPVLIGVAVNQINTMVDRTLASTLAEGSISALNYANRLNGFVITLFITSVVAVIYPKLSKLSSEGNRTQFINSVSRSINSVIILVVPISVGAIVLANPIVRLLFERGNFDARATEMTSIALVMYSIGMVAYGLRDILSKVFYSLQDTRTPMINGAIAMAMNIVLNIILVKYLQLSGLALATSISAIICIFLLFYKLKNKIGYFGQDKIIDTTLKVILSSIIMGICTFILYKSIISFLGTQYIHMIIALFSSVLVGVLVYSILIVLFKVEEVIVIKATLKKKLKL